MTKPNAFHSLCPQCGPNVMVDEDECCIHCGALAVGEGAKAALKAMVSVVGLKARLKDRERRIKLAVSAIPVDDDWDNVTDSELHNYSRVSERTIENVEKVLNLKKPLTKYQRSRK